MANNIELAKNYTDLLDTVFKEVSITADLTSGPELVRAGNGVNEIVYPQVSVTGLRDYDRVGYKEGRVALTWKTAKFNYDRGLKISVDYVDNEETMGLAFGKASAELIRTKVAPEADAFFFSTVSQLTGITKVAETIDGAEAFLAALLNAKNALDEAEVPGEGRYLYATPFLLNSVMALDSYKSKEILTFFDVKKGVPQTRFYTKIDLINDTEDGYYAKAADALDLNFAIIYKPAIIKFDKHVASDIFQARENQSADSYFLKYRKYGMVDALENKRAGIYISHVPAPAPAPAPSNG